jgi:outer membrane protein assembly factor BamB
MQAMIDVKRIRTLLGVALIAPLAACSTVPNPLDLIPGRGNGEDNERLNGDAPTDGRVSILNFEQGLSLDSGDAVHVVDLPTAYVNTVWPQPGGYPTNAVQHTQASGPLDIAWRQSFGNGSDNDHRLNARPVIAGGFIYVIDARGEVVAMNADTGAVAWRHRIEATRNYDRMSFGGGLAFDGGRLYVHTGLNFFVALDAASGSEIWRSETLVPFHGSPTVADGRVFVSSDDNELLALDAATGQVQWTYQGIVESARLLTTPSPAVLGDIVVAPFASGELIALRVQNGNPIWQDSLTRAGGLTAMSEINDVAGSPVVVDNTVYAMSHSGLLAAISLRTGERIWSQPAGGLHAPWVAGDFLFLTTSEAEIVCINRLNGEVYWITQLSLFENARERKNRLAWTGPVMAGGRLVVASSRGDMVVLDAYTGNIVSERDLPGDVFVPPVIANETVYVVTDDARMIALR